MPDPEAVSRWKNVLKEIARTGLADAHPYDVERYEQIDQLADRLDEGDLTRWRASLEAVSKTGWSLTRSDHDRARYEEALAIAIEMGDGVEFFGPASPPRATVDNKLVSVASRYVTPKVSVSAAVDDGHGQLLMVKRADRGQWTIPGGYADPGLSASEVAVKEVLEETGIEVEVVALLAEFDALRHAGEKIPAYSLLFHCVAVGGKLKHHSEEALDAGWFKRSTVPSPLWQDGDVWLELSLRAAEGVRQRTYFDPPR